MKIFVLYIPSWDYVKKILCCVPLSAASTAATLKLLIIVEPTQLLIALVDKKYNYRWKKRVTTMSSSEKVKTYKAIDGLQALHTKHEMLPLFQSKSIDASES